RVRPAHSAAALRPYGAGWISRSGAGCVRCANQRRGARALARTEDCSSARAVAVFAMDGDFGRRRSSRLVRIKGARNLEHWMSYPRAHDCRHLDGWKSAGLLAAARRRGGIVYRHDWSGACADFDRRLGFAGTRCGLASGRLRRRTGKGVAVLGMLRPRAGRRLAARGTRVAFVPIRCRRFFAAGGAASAAGGNTSLWPCVTYYLANTTNAERSTSGRAPRGMTAHGPSRRGALLAGGNGEGRPYPARFLLC